MKAFIVVALMILSGCSTQRGPCRGSLQPINKAPTGAIAHPAERQ